MIGDGACDANEAAGVVLAPTGVAVLHALADGTARPLGELARMAGVPVAVASAQVREWLAGGLLTAAGQGRHRYYRLTAARADVLRRVLARTRAPSLHALPAKGDASLRRARCCYRHLAGALGVAFCAMLLRREWLQTDACGLSLSSLGAAALTARGLKLAAVADLSGRGCLDWTERRTHLGGPLGVGLTNAMFDAGWLRRLPSGRAVVPSVEGLRRLGGFGGAAGLSASAPVAGCCSHGRVPRALW